MHMHDQSHTSGEASTSYLNDIVSTSVSVSEREVQKQVGLPYLLAEVRDTVELFTEL